jgi:hypothetical protein
MIFLSFFLSFFQNPYIGSKRVQLPHWMPDIHRSNNTWKSEVCAFFKGRNKRIYFFDLGLKYLFNACVGPCRFRCNIKCILWKTLNGGLVVPQWKCGWGERGRGRGKGKGEGMPEMDDSEFIQNPDTINRCIDKLWRTLTNLWHDKNKVKHGPTSNLAVCFEKRWKIIHLMHGLEEGI